ncbi:MAG: hypothetical protein WC840_04040 [Candidatus Peribacteraceae bacterium]
MQSVCQKCRASFDIYADEEAFLSKIGFTFGRTTVHPPPPVYCPDCRLKIRTCHRNERFMYRRKSTLSGKEIVSLVHDEPLWGKPYTVCSSEEWNADANDFCAYGREYDFSRPFFGQFADLHKAVPRMALTVVSNENSDFTTGTGYCRNCYLINSSEYCEDCYYGKLIQSCKNSVDCSYLYDSELCYECFSVYSSYNCLHLSFSRNCRDCSFSTYLVGCSNCCLCSNLRQKDYHFLNQPLPEEEYERRVRDFRGSWAKTVEMKKMLQEVRWKMVYRASNIVQSEHCTGDFIENSRSCLDCYDVNESQDCRYVTVGVKVKDNVDCSNMYIKPELCYETMGTIEVYSVAYCIYVFHSQNLLYCQYCYNCRDCFGCDGLKRKQHCILNKQYTKEEYETLVPKIIEHMRHDGNGAAMNPSGATAVATAGGEASSGSWGKFFPPALSPYGYNESLASEYMPLTKKEALSQGFYWRTVEEKKPVVTKTIGAADLPDRIGDIPDDVLNWAIVCEVTGRPFRIIKQELDFYHRQEIPLPRVHPDERYDARLRLRNPRKLWTRPCMKCGKEMQTTFGPDRPDIVYCENCYLKEVY